MSWVLPVLILALLVFSIARRTDVYEAFTAGAKEVVPLILRIFPYIGAIMISISAFRACGAFDAFTDLLAPAFKWANLPKTLAPLVLLRPFSGNGAMALLKDVFDACGVDSFEGFAASILLGSTETVFYISALYFGSIGVKKLRHALTAALLATFAGSASALVLARIYYV